MLLFFFKQKTAYELRISDWSSDVCSSDLQKGRVELLLVVRPARADGDRQPIGDVEDIMREEGEILALLPQAVAGDTDIGDSVEPGEAAEQRRCGRTKRRPDRAAKDRKSTRLNSSH